MMKYMCMKEETVVREEQTKRLQIYTEKIWLLVKQQKILEMEETRERQYQQYAFSSDQEDVAEQDLGQVASDAPVWM